MYETKNRYASNGNDWSMNQRKVSFTQSTLLGARCFEKQASDSLRKREMLKVGNIEIQCDEMTSASQKRSDTIISITKKD